MKTYERRLKVHKTAAIYGEHSPPSILKSNSKLSWAVPLVMWVADVFVLLAFGPVAGQQANGTGRVGKHHPGPLDLDIGK